MMSLDCQSGSGDAVVTYRTPAELHELISRFSADPAERRRRAELGREIASKQRESADAVEVRLAPIDAIVSPGEFGHLATSRAR
jgi:hypothetical protein